MNVSKISKFIVLAQLQSEDEDTYHSGIENSPGDPTVMLVVVLQHRWD